MLFAKSLYINTYKYFHPAVLHTSFLLNFTSDWLKLFIQLKQPSTLLNITVVLHWCLSSCFDFTVQLLSEFKQHIWASFESLQLNALSSTVISEASKKLSQRKCLIWFSNPNHLSHILSKLMQVVWSLKFSSYFELLWREWELYCRPTVQKIDVVLSLLILQ